MFLISSSPIGKIWLRKLCNKIVKRIFIHSEVFSPKQLKARCQVSPQFFCLSRFVPATPFLLFKLLSLSFLPSVDNYVAQFLCDHRIPNYYSCFFFVFYYVIKTNQFDKVGWKKCIRRRSKICPGKASQPGQVGQLTLARSITLQ